MATKTCRICVIRLVNDILVVLALVLIIPPASASEGRIRSNVDAGWRFRLGEDVEKPYAAEYNDQDWDLVSLPHSESLFPASMAHFEDHGRNSGWYRREIQVPSEWTSKKVFLEFRGAMQTTALWVNGQKAGEYAVSGFDSFGFDITPYIHTGTNIIAVKVDNRPNAQIPPDGPPRDYILFGGLYRDVFLHVTDPVHVTFPWEPRQAGVRVTPSTVSEQETTIQAEATVRNDSSQSRKITLLTEIRDRDGKLASSANGEQDIAPGQEATFTQKCTAIAQPHLWSPNDPYLYQVSTIVRDGDKELDRVRTPFGVRWVKFDAKKGFFLNGKHLKLIGANYHQTWPFIGNAVPDGLRRKDAEQMKAMGINWVRLSHYPHDPAFLDMLDELGLMAMEEPPTWMMRGGSKWMVNLEASFRSMIRRDRNHPCIILWAACINHNGAEPALVRAAKEEDPTRDRGQDTVPIPMNFAPLQISGQGALAVEHTGHTFPAERGSRAMKFRTRDGSVATSINREYEQAERHWEQVNAAYAKEDNSGLAVW